MENGLVNLINNLPADRYRHVIICLTMATEFRERIEKQDVEIIECHKPPGKHLPTYWRIYRELRRLRPDLVHTRNLGTIDFSWIAWLARCPRRIHGEHGWSPDDPRGRSRKYRLLRRLCDPVIERYVAVSSDIQHWLTDVIGVAESKTQVLHNGVDVNRFSVSRAEESKGESPNTAVSFGTLGRQEPIKGLDVFLAAVRDVLRSESGWRDRV
jgi:glycosyltransferase involved in cell wall biosynthesis